MNTFNRVAFIVILLVFIGLALALLLFPIQSLGFATDNLATLQDNLLVDNTAFLWYVLAVVLFLLLCLVLLYLEIRPSRKRTVLIRTEREGKVRIGVDSVAQSLGNRIDELPGVRDVRPQVISRGPDARVVVDLRTSPTVNVPEVTNGIIELVHQILEDQLGVRIRGDVEVNVAHEPFPRGTLAPGTTSRPTAEREPAREPVEEQPRQPVEEPRPVRVERERDETPPRREEEGRAAREGQPEEVSPPAPAPSREIVPQDEFDLEPEDLGHEDQEEQEEEEPSVE